MSILHLGTHTVGEVGGGCGQCCATGRSKPVSPRINVCAKEGDSYWADVILPEQQGEEQELDPDLRVLRSWMKEGAIAAQSPDVEGLWTHRPLLKWKDGVLWYL